MPDNDGQGKDAGPLCIEPFDSPDAVQGQRQPAASPVQAAEAEECVRQDQSSRIDLILLLGAVDRLGSARIGRHGVGQREHGGNVVLRLLRRR